MCVPRMNQIELMFMIQTSGAINRSDYDGYKCADKPPHGICYFVNLNAFYYIEEHIKELNEFASVLEVSLLLIYIYSPGENFICNCLSVEPANNTNLTISTIQYEDLQDGNEGSG